MLDHQTHHHLCHHRRRRPYIMHGSFLVCQLMPRAALGRGGGIWTSFTLMQINLHAMHQHDFIAFCSDVNI
jgi:hypothetical protein